MSINMANVKSITLGGVQVKKIEDTSGRVLWGNSTQTATIELTVGAGQDITTTQSNTQLNLPSLETIKSTIRTKTGRVVYNITKVEVYGSEPLFWKPGSSNTSRPWLSSNSSGTKPTSPYIIGTSRFSTSSSQVFGRGYVDVITLINDTSTAPFYGWMQVGTDTTWYRMNGGNRGTLCDSTGNSLPKYKIRVTYEY